MTDIVESRRIFAIATDTAGCFLYRLHWPLTHLDPTQFKIMWRWPDPAELQPGDVVIGQRLAGHNQAWLDLCARPGILTVYDIDDDLIDMDPANTVPYSIYMPVREGTITNIAAAGVVTCSTPHLATKIADRWNPNTVVLPNCLPPTWLQPRPAGPDQVTIGWGGSMFHAQDWPGVGPALAVAAQQNPRLQFATVGANYMSPHVHVSSYAGWSTFDRYHANLTFDVGLAPLARTEFNHGKSWAKLLEYASRGIPAVATRWGQYPQWFRLFSDDPPGVLIDEPDEIPDAIQYILADPDRWTAMSAAALRRAQRYTIDQLAWRWANVYQQAGGA